VTSGSCEVDRERTSERASERPTGRFHASVSPASPAASERVTTFLHDTDSSMRGFRRRSLVSSLSLLPSRQRHARELHNGATRAPVSVRCRTIFNLDRAFCACTAGHAREIRGIARIPIAETSHGEETAATRTAERVVSRYGNQFFAQGHRAFKFSEVAALRPNGSSRTFRRFPPKSRLNLSHRASRPARVRIPLSKVKGSRKTRASSM